MITGTTGHLAASSALQRHMAMRMGAQLSSVRSSHALFLSRPREATAIILAEPRVEVVRFASPPWLKESELRTRPPAATFESLFHSGKAQIAEVLSLAGLQNQKASSGPTPLRARGDSLGFRFHIDDVVEAGLCHFGRLLDSQLHAFGGASRTFDGSLHKRHCKSASRMAQKVHMETAMPINLLDQIADRPMPYVTNDEREIEHLRVLHKAGHVLCQLPSEQMHRNEAVVHQVTALGRRVLRHFGPSTSYGQPGFWH